MFELFSRAFELKIKTIFLLNLSHIFGSPFISGISGNKSQIEPYSTSNKHLGVNGLCHISQRMLKTRRESKSSHRESV